MEIWSATLGCVLGLALLAASSAASGTEWGSIYRPDLPEECPNNGAFLSLNASSGGCLTISGRVEYSYTWSTVDGRLPALRSNVFATAIEASDLGPVKAVLGIEGYNGWNIEPVPDWYNYLYWRDDVRVSDAYVQLGTDVQITVGSRTAQWGSIGVIDSPNFWVGNLARPFFAAHQITDWAAAPSLGGHVIQIEGNPAQGLVLSAGLEALDNVGTALGTIEYYGDHVTTYASVLHSGVLSGSRSTAARAGLNVEFGSTELWASAAATWFEGREVSDWVARGVLDHDFGLFGVTASAEASGKSIPWTWCHIFGCVTSITREEGSLGTLYGYSDLSDFFRLEAGGVVAWSSGSLGDLNHQFVSVRARVQATEHINVLAELGVLSTKRPNSQEDLLFGETSVNWDTGSDLSASARLRYQGNGAFNLKAEIEKGF